MQFGDSGLDKLRQELLQHPGAVDALDSEALQLYLRDRGCSHELDILLVACAAEPRRFMRADSPIEKARDGWDEAFDLYHRQKARDADIRQTASDLATDWSEERVARLNALKREHTNEA